MGVSWRAWTTEGRFDSGGHRWADLPEDGILMVVVYVKNSKTGQLGRRKMSGDDYYFKCGDLIGCNNHDPEETRQRYPGCVIKRGRWVEDRVFREIDWQVMEEPLDAGPGPETD